MRTLLRDFHTHFFSRLFLLYWLKKSHTIKMVRLILFIRRFTIKIYMWTKKKFKTSGKQMLSWSFQVNSRNFLFAFVFLSAAHYFDFVQLLNGKKKCKEMKRTMKIELNSSERTGSKSSWQPVTLWLYTWKSMRFSPSFLTLCACLQFGSIRSNRFFVSCNHKMVSLF